MRLTHRLQLLLLILLCTACSGPRSLTPDIQPGLTPLHGTSAETISLEQSGETLRISFAGIPPQGSFARLLLPDTCSVVSSRWTYSGEAVALAVATEDGADLGIAPVAGSGPDSACVELRVSRHRKSVSSVPSGSQNRVTDLEISTFDEDEALLEWTEVNTGDYDFNGEVNIADIAPIAVNFNKSYNPNSENLLEQTLYWVDGDKNNEINVADLTPVALNFGHEIAGYYILRNSVRIKIPEAEQPQLFARADAEFRVAPSPLPPRYIAVVKGTTSDSWSVVPVGGQGDEGTVSAGVISGKTFDAKASVIISGINLWQFEDDKEDSGFTRMWVIDPIDDVDWAHIGEKYVGPGGVAVFSGLPKNTELFLEIAYAPKTSLLTGEPVTREEALATPFRTRMPFVLPETAELVEFAPEIKISSLEEGVSIDLYALLPAAEGTKALRSRLLLPAGLVAYDTDGDASYIDQPFLHDSDNDSVSDQRIRLLLDRRAYEGGTQAATRHRGIVTLFDQGSGYLVLSEAEFWDEEGLGWTPEPFPREIAYNFYELTGFRDPAKTFMIPGSIILGENLEVDGFFLSDLAEGLPKKHWANQISRTIDP